MDDSQEWPAMVALLKPQRRSLHTTITPAFGLSLILFVLVACLAYRCTSRLAAAGKGVAAAQEVLTRLATANNFFERAEVELRGFIVTGERTQFDRMQAALAQAGEDMKSVRAAAAGTPEQQQTFDQLNAALTAEAAAIQRLASLRTEQGAEPALAAVGQAASASAIRTVRDLFEQMRAEQSVVLRQRQAAAAEEEHNRIWAFICVAGAVLLGTSLSYALVLEYEMHVRRGESDLRKAKQDAESASHFKTTFLAKMSHEIRTPLTAIMGFADLLARPALGDAERMEFVQTIRRNGSHLLNVVNDILDLSKIEAGKMEVERIACSPAQIAEDVVELLRPKAAERGNTLESWYIGPCPETIRTDPTRLRQVLTNLLANAMKFTEHGSVRLTVQMADARNGQCRIQFNVIDTGIGMNAEQITGLFEPFSQADTTTTRKFGGTGLGLTISRQFARMLGGDITVVSQPGAGSTFSVEVATGDLGAVRMLDNPRQALQRAKEQHSAGEGPKFSGRILLAEDGLTNQQLICLYLREAGAEVEVAENGRVACEKVAAAAKAGKPFHLVLMDMEMPEMDGCQATLAMRNTGQRLPIIALTANAMSSDKDHCLSAGCNAFVTKPIDWPRLLDMIAGYLCDKDTSGKRHRDPHLTRVLKTFMAELDESAKELRAALTAGDRAALAHLAHSLRGTAGNCGFLDLANASAEVEQLAKDTSPSETVTRAAEKLLALCTSTRATPQAA